MITLQLKILEDSADWDARSIKFFEAVAGRLNLLRVGLSIGDGFELKRQVYAPTTQQPATRRRLN